MNSEYIGSSLCALYLLACQVRVTVGDLGLRCVCVTSFKSCVCVTSFKCGLTPLFVNSVGAPCIILFVSHCVLVNSFFC